MGTWTAASYATLLGIDRRSARERLDRLVSTGRATRERVTEVVQSSRYGRVCMIEQTFHRYHIRENT